MTGIVQEGEKEFKVKKKNMSKEGVIVELSKAEI